MRAVWALLIMAISVPGVPATAANLDPEVCKVLVEEHKRVVTDDIKTELEKGPEWARTHLSQYRLQKIEKIFQIEEQLAFRCLTIKKGTKKEDAITLPEGVPGGAIEARAKSEKAAAPKVIKKPAQNNSNNPAQTKKKKPKTSDAYVPPKPGG